MRSNLRSFYAAELLLAVDVAPVLVDELDAGVARRPRAGANSRIGMRAALHSWEVVQRSRLGSMVFGEPLNACSAAVLIYELDEEECCPAEEHAGATGNR